jgi:hypothetical protein
MLGPSISAARLERKHQPQLTSETDGCRCACEGDAREGATDAFGRVKWVS